MGVGSIPRRSRALATGRGFTLVELLVVMVIVGVLAAIVYPVIVKVKETAKTSECISNMRQIGAAMHMYLDQYDDRLPTATRAGSPQYWATYGEKTIQELLNPYVRNGMRAKVQNNVVSYEDAGVFACPSDVGLTADELVTDDTDRAEDGMVGLWGIVPDQPVWRYTGCSYQYYSDDQEDRFMRDPKPIKWTALSPRVNAGDRVGAPFSSIVAPTRKAMLGDIGFWHMGDKIPGPRIAYVNTLFTDGHASRVKGSAHNEARITTLRQWCAGY